jgi:hypothetical protein
MMIMSLSQMLVFLFYSFAFSADTVIHGLPSVDIQVRQELDALRFQFFQDIDGKTVEHGIFTLQVYRFSPGETTLWKIIASNPNIAAKEVTYGRLPYGFLQQFPTKGLPPPLEDGMKYEVSVRGGGSGHVSFVYKPEKQPEK